MSWLGETRVYRSEKNGEIVCRRLFGRWEVQVGGFHESSRYLASMWRGAYRRLPADFAPREALMLGLGAGDNIRLLAGRYPECRVTAVEWDPVMVEIADTLGVFRREHRPSIIVGDAGEVLRSLEGSYDLVIVDIFTGGAVAGAVYDPRFFENVGRRLRPDGLVMVNAFWEPEALVSAGRHLTKVETWRGLNNHLGIFSGPCAPERR